MYSGDVANLNFCFSLKFGVSKMYVWLITKINNSVHTNLVYEICPFEVFAPKVYSSTFSKQGLPFCYSPKAKN